MKPIIEVNHLYKKYRYGLKQPYYSFRDTLVDLAKLPFRQRAKSNKGEFWALKDISFKVMPGEVIGIIGRNGAGKSTLLKILSRITPPTKGEITLRGRVASLLEVGTGFSQELTGRENIFLNGAILGMKRVEVNDKFDEIVEFAEISKFLDTPVKFYSSGMYMRLAFAIAAHLEPEILLVDEVLSVGDIEFQKKCLGKMGEVAKAGRTVLFVSHNIDAIQLLCPKTILVRNGKIQEKDETKKVIDLYKSTIKEISKIPVYRRKDRIGRGNIKIKRVKLLNKNKKEFLISGENLTVFLVVENFYNRAVEIRPSISIRTLTETGLISCDAALTGKTYLIPPFSKSKLVCKIYSPPLNSGEFYINVAVYQGEEAEDWITSAIKFSVRRNLEKFSRRSQFPILTKFEWS